MVAMFMSIKKNPFISSLHRPVSMYFILLDWIGCYSGTHQNLVPSIGGKIGKARCFPFFLSFFFKLLYCCSITVVFIFPSLLPPPANPTSLPCFRPTPWFCPSVLYSSSWKPFPPLSPPPSPLAIVRLFLTSMSLVIFCLLFSSVDYVPVKGEII